MKLYALYLALADWFGFDFPQVIARTMGANRFETLLQSIVDDYGLNINDLISRKEYGNAEQK